MLLLIALFACTPAQPASPPESGEVPQVAPKPAENALRPEFGPLVKGGPTTGIEATVREVKLGVETIQIGFHPVVTTGETYDGAVFGELVDEKGERLPWPEGADAGGAPNRVCNVGDYGSLITAHDQLFHIAHLECGVGGISVTPLTQGDDGLLTAGAPKLADLSAVHGGTTFCSGDTTPWNTHIGGEEYDANARVAIADGRMPDSEMAMRTKHPWDWSFLNEHLVYRSDLSAYDYGYITEVEITDAEGSTQVAKHYAMGRFSHELGLVMPDQRTVFLTDDQYHAGFFMFVADKEADLSAGTLYAARWNQNNAEGEATMDWVSLGHATDAQLRAQLFEKRPAFSDLFATAELVDNTCPEGFGRTTTTWGTECLKVLDEVAASRFETRRYAGLKGGTTEFNKNEGLAFDRGTGPDDATLFVAMSKIDVGMLDETDKSRGPETADYRRTADQDHIQMTKNGCGIVFSMKTGESVDQAGAVIASDWVMRKASPLVVGEPVEGGCAETGISNPDNITFVDAFGMLIVAEDTSKHAADTLWAVNPAQPEKLIPLMQVAKNSEVTGLHWHPNINGWGYLTVSHQWSESDWPKLRSVMGVLGPFPVKNAEN